MKEEKLYHILVKTWYRELTVIEAKKQILSLLDENTESVSDADELQSGVYTELENGTQAEMVDKESEASVDGALEKRTEAKEVKSLCCKAPTDIDETDQHYCINCLEACSIKMDMFVSLDLFDLVRTRSGVKS